MRTVSAILLSASLAGSALAQIGANHTQYPANECGPDLLVDDFATSQTGILPFANETTVRQLNLLKADYGSDGSNLTFAVNTDRKVMEIVAKTTSNFFFSKFDASACFDATNFHGVAFDLLAPTGGDFSMTMTQKNADCIDRTDYGPSDSDYVSIKKYIVPNGTKQPVVVPFSDYRTNVGKKAYDFVHLKDWTLNNFSPAGSVWEISNLRLVYACKDNGPYGKNDTHETLANPPTNTVAAPGATGTGGAAAENQHSSASRSLYALGTTVLGLVGAFFGGVL